VLAAARDHDGHGITDTDLQLVGEREPEHDAIRSRCQIGELALAHRIADRGYLGFERGIDAAHDRSAHVLATAQHGIGIEIRRGADEAARAMEILDRALPVRDRRAVGRRQHGVRRNAQQARP
jgi:hypothetical protein